jgi:hypothetical protein
MELIAQKIPHLFPLITMGLTEGHLLVLYPAASG